MKTIKILVLLFALLPASISAQNAEAIVKQAKQEFDKIKDYQADANIKLDLDMVRMPVKKAKVYFKQPSKLKIDAQGFMMVHKKTMNININEFLNGGYTALYIKTDIIDGFATHVIKIIPKDEKSDNVLTTLWIDCQKLCLRKIENSSKSTGSFVVNMKYGANPYNLPDQMTVSFDAGKNQGIQMAAGMQDMGKSKGKKLTKGSVTINYSNYVVNKGIADSVFDKKQ